MKGFRCAKLWLDIADEANTLGEEDEDGSLEHSARQHEVSIETEVVNHIDEEENRKVEEGADGKGVARKRSPRQEEIAAMAVVLQTSQKGDASSLHREKRICCQEATAGTSSSGDARGRQPRVEGCLDRGVRKPTTVGPTGKEEVDAPEVMGLDFGVPIGVLLLDFGVPTGAAVSNSEPSTGAMGSQLWTVCDRRSDQKRPWAQRPQPPAKATRLCA
ncbi:hypothetical protein GW17_00052811 [Ensete ventricosum]|nr:hypothetical protein GW17_00052811 [Ensete ventricosum]